MRNTNAIVDCLITFLVNSAPTLHIISTCLSLSSHFYTSNILDPAEAAVRQSARKRSKSQSSAGRSRTSSRDKVTAASTENTNEEEERSRKNSTSRSSKTSDSNITKNLDDSQQPEYMNLSTLEATMAQHRQRQNRNVGEPVKRNTTVREYTTAAKDTLLQTTTVIDQTRPPNWQKKTIGPDAWYNDDFNYDKPVFIDDPFMNQQYGQLLDMRYREQFSHTDIVSPPSAFIVQESSESKSHPEESGYDSMKQPKQQWELQDNLVKVSKSNADQMGTKKSTASSKEKNKERVHRRLKDDGRSQTWHADKFEDFQIMEKQGKKVLLNISHGTTASSKGRDNAPERRTRRKSTSSKQQIQEGETDKVAWSPAKAFEEMRKVKEAPPENLVKDRLRTFQKDAKQSRHRQHSHEKKHSIQNQIS